MVFGSGKRKRDDMEAAEHSDSGDEVDVDGGDDAVDVESEEEEEIEGKGTKNIVSSLEK